MSNALANARKTGDARFVRWIEIVQALPSSEFFLDPEQGGIYTTPDRVYSLNKHNFGFYVLRNGVAFENVSSLREAAKWTNYDRRDIARRQFDIDWPLR